VTFGVFFWFLLVRPGLLVSVFSDGALTDETWLEFHPSLLRLVRIVAGIALFGMGFFTGLALTFLSGTAG
jgi:hypothetical protein